MQPIYSTSDTMICTNHEQTNLSPYNPDSENDALKRPGGKIVSKSREMFRTLTKTVGSFELSRQIYG